MTLCTVVYNNTAAVAVVRSDTVDKHYSNNYRLVLMWFDYNCCCCCCKLATENIMIDCMNPFGAKKLESKKILIILIFKKKNKSQKMGNYYLCDFLVLFGNQVFIDFKKESIVNYNNNNRYSY